MKKLGVLLFVLFGVYAFLYAQQISMPYECGFEDTVEINNWKLNSGTNGSKCNDQWMVGNCDNYEGFKNFDCHAYFDNVGGGCVCSRKQHRRYNM